MQLHFAFHRSLEPSPPGSLEVSLHVSMQGIHTILATGSSSSFISGYCVQCLNVSASVGLACFFSKSAVLYRSGPHLQYHSWFNKYLLWPDCLMSPCISPSELQLGSCVSSLSDCSTDTPHVVLYTSLQCVGERGGGPLSPTVLA